jgi:hypothetical protein
VVVAAQVLDVPEVSGDGVVHTQDFMALFQESLTQMRSDKTRATRDKRPHIRPFC